MPSAAAVAAGEAEPVTEKQQAWLARQGECQRLAVEIPEYPYWETVGDRKAARKALDDAVC